MTDPLDPPKRKKPVGHHHKRYGAVAWGIGILLAGVLLKTIPWYAAWLILGIVAIVAGVVVYSMEEKPIKREAGHHRHRYGAFVVGIALVLLGIFDPASPLNPVKGFITFEAVDIVIVLGVLTLIGGIIAYVREE